MPLIADDQEMGARGLRQRQEAAQDAVHFAEGRPQHGPQVGGERRIMDGRRSSSIP